MQYLATEDGQGLAEYALIMVFVVIVAVAALTLVGTSVSDLLNTVTSAI